MKNVFYFTTAMLLFYTLALLQQASATEISINRTQGYGVAIDFVETLFIKKDALEVQKMISPQATDRNAQPGSAAAGLGDADLSALNLAVHEIMVFNRTFLLTKIIEIGSIYDGVKENWRGKFPSYISRYLSESAVCCLVVYSIKEDERDEEVLISLLVFDDTGNGYKLVHMNDPV